MDDNLPLAQGAEFGLPGHAILAIDGADALRFAQMQFMSDVAGLPDGNWQWSGWLTPKGRVIALFALLRFDAQSLWMLLPDADAVVLREALQRFVFRSKVAFSVRADLHVSAAFAPSASADGSRIGLADGVELDMGATESPRVLCIGERPAAIDTAAASRWAAFDLAHGLPRLAASQAEQWTPQQLSLERLRAFSVKKGCYPGQEIVARTHFLGQAKRGLVLFEADVAVPVGADVTDGERVLGNIVSAGGHLALAVLPLERNAGSLHAGVVALRELSLLDGLAR